jgi:hypothetical protein
LVADLLVDPHSGQHVDFALVDEDLGVLRDRRANRPKVNKVNPAQFAEVAYLVRHVSLTVPWQ